MDKERPMSPSEIELIKEDAQDAPPVLPSPTEVFRKELENLINRHCMENGSDTPDFILAEFISEALKLFDTTVMAREKWYGREKKSDGTVL